MGLIPNEVVAQVLDRSDIVEVIARYIPLKNIGRNFKALCPFHHEKTPSFVISADKQIFHCFGCGVGGNVVTFVMKQERLEFPEAVRMLAERAGIPIPTENDAAIRAATQTRQQYYKIHNLALNFYHQNLLSDASQATKAAIEYLKGRGVTLEMVKKFQIGFALDKWDGLLKFLQKEGQNIEAMEKTGLIIANKKDGYYDRFRNRVIFPIFDSKSQCIAFGGRTMDPNDGAKYVNSTESPIYRKGQHLYGFNWAKEAVSRKDAVLVVEGYLDFIMPFEGGVENIVASCGTALTVDQIRLINRYTKNIIMLFDADPAGEAAMIRSFDLIIEEGLQVKVVRLSEKEDPDSFIRKFGIEKFKERVEAAESLFDFKLKYLMGKHNYQTIEGRAKISEEMLVTINKIENAIVKSEYLKRLAGALGIAEDALNVELQKIAKQAQSGFAPAATATPTQNENNNAETIRPVERELLKLMLEENELIPLTRQEVALSDFKNEPVRRVLQKIFDMHEQGQEANLTNLMSSVEDQQVLQTISALMLSGETMLGDKKRIYGDCIQRLKEERLRSRRRDLMEQMHMAKNTGDSKKLDELTQEFNQLIKR
jgi:DNA primase